VADVARCDRVDLNGNGFQILANSIVYAAGRAGTAAVPALDLRGTAALLFALVVLGTAGVRLATR
jgi:hypothetical protein